MKRNFEYYCKDYENIENYEKAKADNFEGWDCHHRLETHNSDGERRTVDITKKELIALGMYYNRPASELIFLTVSEHMLLHNECEHNPMYGKKHSDESKKKMSEAKKGKKLSEETRNKMSEAHKGKHAGENNSMYGKHHTEESKKKMSEAKKGKHHSEETKKRLSEAKKGMHWYNNGKISKRAKECPPGFVPGMINRK